MVEWAEGGTFELTEGGVTEPIDPATLATVVPAVHARTCARCRRRRSPSTPTPASWPRRSARWPAIAEAIVALAAAFGGRSVATAEFATREPETPLALAARPGERVVAQIGAETFAFPEGWP